MSEIAELEHISGILIISWVLVATSILYIYGDYE